MPYSKSIKVIFDPPKLAIWGGLSLTFAPATKHFSKSYVSTRNFRPSNLPPSSKSIKALGARSINNYSKVLKIGFVYFDLSSLEKGY